MTLEILTNAQMRAADQAAIRGGIPAYTLMQQAGQAVFEAIASRIEPCTALVICGPGNNGGDGYVVAQQLLEAGWEVAVHASQPPATEEAKRAAADYKGPLQKKIRPALLVVDALYGTGLARPIEGAEAELIRQVNEMQAFVASIDIPSGVNGDTGEVMGAAIEAELTLALARKKRGVALMPGRYLCGEITVADIGIDDAIIDAAGVHVRENSPELWLEAFPFARMDQHKYSRGHAIITGGDVAHTGAARLAALAALRAGAGLVSISCTTGALPVYAAGNLAVMCKITDTIQDYASLLADVRVTAVAIGPGNGVHRDTRERVLAALGAHKPLVLDADGLTVFTDNPQELFGHIQSGCVMTPHEGEFTRLFGQAGIDPANDKITRALEAAKLARAVVLLKGADTVIASPEGSAVINTNAPPMLATAGSGDVLTGIITGLIAAGMDAFLAACAAAWLHGAAAQEFGDGLVADDLPGLLPTILSQLRAA